MKDFTLVEKVKQLFCNHDTVSHLRKDDKFQHLQGTRIYHICDKCGKVIQEEFISNEEFSRRYRL